MSPIINIYKLCWENKVTVWISSPLPPPAPNLRMILKFIFFLNNVQLSLPTFQG